MSTRSSGRAPKPPQRLITIEEGPQLASRSDRVGFAQLGEQHAREVESRGGEEPTDEEVDEVSVVPSGPGSAAAHPTTEPRQKKTRVSKKWNTLYDLVLAQKGERERERAYFSGCFFGLFLKSACCFGGARLPAPAASSKTSRPQLS